MNLKNNKKGVAGIDFMKELAIGIFILVIIFFALAIAGASLSSTSTARVTHTVLNESGYINNSIYTVDNASNTGFAGFSISEIRNATDQIIIGAGNYTIGSGTVVNSTSLTWDDVDIDYSFTLPVTGQAGNIIDEFTSAISGFSSSISTWLILGALVVLISIIVIIILVVNRVNQGKGGSL